MAYCDTHVERVLIDQKTLTDRVGQLGAEISRDYQETNLFVVGVLKGAMIFLADLTRCIDLPLSFDFVAVSSYGAGTSSSGAVRILKDLDVSVEGRHVLLVEDIVDSGLTLSYLRGLLLGRKPASLRVCTLLDKPSRRRVPVHLDYRGFEIPDAFVVGYGLDYNEQYRHLPYIAVLRPEVYRS
ncbi:MAG: hypoxanthine phosphoribosyltransferase [Bacillota bacterium]